MPRNGAGAYTLDPNYLVAEGDTILPSQHNPVFEDLQTDANTPRPITAGGTGASSAVTARQNLAVPSVAEVEAGYTKKVATRTALKALDTAITKAVVLTEASRQKLFMWMTGDFTDSVASDPSELAYIPADGIDPALGCWVAVTGAGASIVPVIQGGTGANDAPTALDNLGGMATATYDPTAKAADAFDMSNMVEGADAKILTAAERASIAGAVQASANLSDLSDKDAALVNLGGPSIEVLVQRDPRWFGAIGDGNSHPLSNYYATLAEAKVDFPQATALTDERDMCALLKMIGLGQKIYMSGSAQFRINRQMLITSAVYWDGDCTCTLLPDMSIFTNNTRAGELGATGCPILIRGEISGAFTPLEGVRVGGFKVDGGGAEDRRTNVVGLQNLYGPKVSHIEATGFAVGNGIYGERLYGSGAAITHVKVYDWYSDAAYGGDNPTSQATGIGLDDGSVNGLRSEGVDIAYNEVTNLLKGPTLTAALGVQTDGINIKGQAASTNHRIRNNYFEGVDEGIDTYGHGQEIFENEGRNLSGAFLKFAHGASDNHVHHNRGYDVGRYHVTLTGSDDGPVENNLFENNVFTRVTAGANARACIDVTDVDAGSPAQNNIFRNNRLDPGAGGLACIRSTTAFGVNYYPGNIYVSKGSSSWVLLQSGDGTKAVITAPVPGSRFRATLAANQALSASPTTMLFTSILEDLFGEYDAGAQLYRAKLPGLRRCAVVLRLSAMPASTAVTLRFNSGGVNYVHPFDFGVGGEHFLHASRDIYMAENDLLSVTVVGLTGGQTVTAGEAYTCLNVQML